MPGAPVDTIIYKGNCVSCCTGLSAVWRAASARNCMSSSGIGLLDIVVGKSFDFVGLLLIVVLWLIFLV